jgi:hypothetical protein
VITLALSGAIPDARVVETVPALLSWNALKPALLRAYGIVTETTRRLAWLADVALAVDRQGGFPAGCRRDPLERFLKTVEMPGERTEWDDLGHPGETAPASPLWRRWRINYGATLEDFARRARQLDAARDLPGAGRLGVRASRSSKAPAGGSPALGRHGGAAAGPRQAGKGRSHGS